MSRQEWWVAGVVALGVALLTAAMTAGPRCWADGVPLPPVPKLPSTQLTIPSLGARVTATATPAPGQPVNVTLTLTAPAPSVTQVPVTVTILSTTMSPLSRSLPLPKKVLEMTATVPVDPDGTGTAIVALPLTWAVPAPAAADPVIQLEERPVTLYQLRLSSSLGGTAAPSDVQGLLPDGLNRTATQGPS